MRLTAVVLALVTSSALAAGTKAPETKAPEAKAGENSTFVVRCTDDCTVRVDGKAGLRLAPNNWEFKDVTPGQRRVEATGGFLNRPLYNGYADIPAGMKVTAQIDSSKRLTITERRPLSEEKAAQAAAGGPSVMNVRCPKQCSVSIDGLRKGAASSQTVVVRDITPGQHNVEVKFVLGTKVVRSLLNIPAASEVFVTATEGGLSITNSKPLAK
jgi:hypothetical protein